MSFYLGPVKNAWLRLEELIDDVAPCAMKKLTEVDSTKELPHHTRSITNPWEFTERNTNEDRQDRLSKLRQQYEDRHARPRGSDAQTSTLRSQSAQSLDARRDALKIGIRDTAETGNEQMLVAPKQYVQVRTRLLEAQAQTQPLPSEPARKSHVRGPAKEFKPLKADKVDTAKALDKDMSKLQRRWENRIMQLRELPGHSPSVLDEPWERVDALAKREEHDVDTPRTRTGLHSGILRATARGPREAAPRMKDGDHVADDDWEIVEKSEEPGDWIMV